MQELMQPCPWVTVNWHPCWLMSKSLSSIREACMRANVTAVGKPCQQLPAETVLHSLRCTSSASNQAVNSPLQSPAVSLSSGHSCDASVVHSESVFNFTWSRYIKTVSKHASKQAYRTCSNTWLGPVHYTVAMQCQHGVVAHP